MANLVISERCNLACSYCFASDYLDGHHGDIARHSSPFIDLETFENWLDFLDRSNIDEIRLIGGEPSLHPHFQEILHRAMRRGKHILVFTHGLLSEGALASLEALPLDQVTVLVNMNASRHLHGPSPKENARRRETLLRLGGRVQLGFTIYQPDFSLDYLLPLILETGCQKSVRLGIAQPVLGGRNQYLHPKQYINAGRRLVGWAERAGREGVWLEFDCGFVRCMFSQTDLERLRQAGAGIAYRCNPILDIGLNEKALHCFPLAGTFHTELKLTLTAGELRAILVEKVRPYRLAGIYKECTICRYKQSGECMGGCLAATIRRFQPAKININIYGGEND